MNEWISSEVGLPTSLMASWAKSSGGGGGGIRRPPPSNNPNGSGPPQPHRAFRRPAPYPKPEERDNTQESYEEVDSQQHDYSGNMQYEGYQHQQNEVEMKSLSQRVSLYQKFYRQVQEQRKPADCVVLSVSSGSTDYPKSLGLCLQERGLSVEMLYLQAESGLTRALQDVRADGSPFCILVEQTNVSLSSCTVIIFSESLKIHRNMPKDQAMEFVTNEYGRGPSKQKNAPSDPADIAARSSELVDDFLEREKIERHVVPSETRQLLLLLAEGVHMYPEELGTIADYLRSRQDHAQASTAEGSRGNMLPPGLGKPPPLLPTPPGPPPGIPSGGGSGQSLAEALADHSPSQPTPLLSSSGSYPKTKPPPLLSLHRPPGPPHGPGQAQQGPSGPRGPPPSHNPYGAPGPRGPPPHHVPPYHLGPRGAPPHGIRGPPSLRSLRPQAPLLANPGGPPPRPNGPRR